MTLNRNHFIAAPQREAVISLTALYYIEEQALLNAHQLEDAKNSLQALFLRTSGEETTLRQLIEMLKLSRSLHRSFANISTVLHGAAQCAQTSEQRAAALREDIERLAPSAEERRDVIDPLLDFAHRFQTHMTAFVHALQQYIARKETEARARSVFQLALAAREQLKQRLSGTLGTQTGGEVEHRIRQELVQSFDYGEAEAAVAAATRDARHQASELRDALKAIKAMCQLAMNPAMREQPAAVTAAAAGDDIYARFTAALPKHPRLAPLRDPVSELFKLYQHTFGIFSLDLTKLNQALAAMLQNTQAYFEAKDEDRDLHSKRDRLRKIEGLIPFLEHGAELTRQSDTDTYYKFSRHLSAAITNRKTPWVHIGEDLLRAKIQAEAELSTRL